MKDRPDHISQEDWDSVDFPPLTDEQLARMRPAVEVDPEAVEAYRRTRGKQKIPTKDQVTLRIDPDIIEYFKKDGRGWQTRLNSLLREATGLG